MNFLMGWLILRSPFYYAKELSPNATPEIAQVQAVKGDREDQQKEKQRRRPTTRLAMAHEKCQMG